MKFKDMIDTSDWPSIQRALERLYPDDLDDLPGYQRVFETLQGLQPNDSALRLVIEEMDDLERQAPVASVVGADDHGSYAIEFTPWGEWLGMSIDEQTRQKYTTPEIIAHSLWEMTFFGYSQEAIQGWIDERVRRKQAGRSIPLEQVRRELGLDEVEGE